MKVDRSRSLWPTVAIAGAAALLRPLEEDLFR